tara:strand:- start:357 stop:1928 length:1572 start_codon:yes stop_codon:yes gene_type:complete
MIPLVFGLKKNSGLFNNKEASSLETKKFNTNKFTSLINEALPEKFGKNNHPLLEKIDWKNKEKNPEYLAEQVQRMLDIKNNKPVTGISTYSKPNKGYMQKGGYKFPVQKGLMVDGKPVSDEFVRNPENKNLKYTTNKLNSLIDYYADPNTQQLLQENVTNLNSLKTINSDRFYKKRSDNKEPGQEYSLDELMKGEHNIVTWDNHDGNKYSKKKLDFSAVSGNTRAAMNEALINGLSSTEHINPEESMSGLMGYTNVGAQHDYMYYAPEYSLPAEGSMSSSGPVSAHESIHASNATIPGAKGSVYLSDTEAYKLLDPYMQLESDNYTQKAIATQGDNVSFAEGQGTIMAEIARKFALKEEGDFVPKPLSEAQKKTNQKFNGSWTPHPDVSSQRSAYEENIKDLKGARGDSFSRGLGLNSYMYDSKRGYGHDYIMQSQQEGGVRDNRQSRQELYAHLTGYRQQILESGNKDLIKKMMKRELTKDDIRKHKKGQFSGYVSPAPGLLAEWLNKVADNSSNTQNNNVT